ncbi:hypothetical protein [Caulobacter sp. BP25]|uniref:hypothetical protein n=1 Tax=Caulobacter sp. BP25 TaxID=2048900 RepID=UPI00117C2108|nr:hypothetical protein [Caulobacter sp. BP25]
MVGLIAATIAYRQWRTAATKLQLELYGLRLPTFQIVRMFLDGCWVGGVSRESLDKLRSAGEEAAFLFNDEVAGFMREIYRNGMTAYMAETGYWDEEDQYSVPPDEDEAEGLWRELRGKRSRAVELFAPFLRLEERNNVAWRSVLRAAEDALKSALEKLF